MLNHFTEKFDSAFCEGTCDNCASTAEVTNVDLTTHATQYVNMFNELEKKHMKITGPQSINAFRATQKPEMARRSFNILKNYGKGSDISVDLVKRLLDHLIVRQILTTDLEEPPDPNRPPISYVYVFILFTLVTLRLIKFFAARAQGKGVSEQTNLHFKDSFRKEGHRRSEDQERFTATGSCTNRLNQEKANRIGRCG